MVMPAGVAALHAPQGEGRQHAHHEQTSHKDKLRALLLLLLMRQRKVQQTTCRAQRESSRDGRFQVHHAWGQVAARGLSDERGWGWCGAATKRSLRSVYYVGTGFFFRRVWAEKKRAANRASARNFGSRPFRTSFLD